MTAFTFMSRLTLYVTTYIHGSMNITCLTVHSSVSAYTRGLIKVSVHVRRRIICRSEHSCIALHYMPIPTFMGYGALHVSPHIHAISYISCHSVHSCRISHYMSPLTFMQYLTLHTLTNIHHQFPSIGVL